MSVFAFPGLSERSSEFVPAVERIAAELRTDPNYLLTIMQLESGLNPAATNPQGGATGLIQFMPATAKRLGTTTTELRTMQDYEQLDYVWAFYRRYTGNLNSPGDVYMVTFYPALAFKPAATVIARKGEKVYDWNKVLDVDKDGVLTVGDVTSKAEGAYARYSKLGAYVPPVETPSEKAAELVTGGGGIIALAAMAAAGIWLLRTRGARIIRRMR